jgi:hypothetical protein
MSELRVDKESTPMNDVLLWLDMSCLLLLWREFHQEGDSPEAQKAERQILSSQEHREKIVKRRRKSQSEQYSAEDEVVDRLFLLGAELYLPPARLPISQKHGPSKPVPELPKEPRRTFSIVFPDLLRPLAS